MGTSNVKFKPSVNVEVASVGGPIVTLISVEVLMVL